MAIDTNTRFSVTIQDVEGVEAANTYYADVDGAGTSAADLIAAWGTLAQKVDAVTGGQITKGSITVVADPTAVTGPSLKTAPISGSKVEQTLVANFSNAISAKKFGEAVPALRDSLVISGKPDLTTGQPINLLSVFLTTATSTLAWANANQQVLEALVDAFISFRKRRKQLRARSFVAG